MRIRFATLVVGLLLLLPFAGNAQHMNAKDAPCQDVGPNAAMTQCFIKAQQDADAHLNVVYGKILRVRAQEDQEKLRTAQRLWVQFRASNCAAERALYAGGSAAPTVFAACMEAVTRQRVAELNVMYGWVLEK